MKKTNAVRHLDSLKIQYRLLEYEVDEEDLSAEHVGAQLGLPLEQVFKTLVVRGDKTGILMACVPAVGEINLKVLAAASGNKRTELVPLKEVLPLTGYIRGGVSPIGPKKPYPVYLDSSALNFPFISISAGVRGCQIVLDPRDLVKVVSATPVPQLLTEPAQQ